MRFQCILTAVTAGGFPSCAACTTILGVGCEWNRELGVEVVMSWDTSCTASRSASDNVTLSTMSISEMKESKVGGGGGVTSVKSKVIHRK